MKWDNRSVLQNLLAILKDCPLIVSAQASEGAAVDDPETLYKLAKTSVDQGVEVVRLEGADNIRHIKAKLSVPVIGLIKKKYPGSEVYITPTEQEVKRLIALGCEIIALDATPRSRPGNADLDALVALIQRSGCLAMADCDSEASIELACKLDFDLVGTTLAGYTDARPMTSGPDYDLVRYAVSKGKPVIAEGRYAQRCQIESALRIGARGVVVGGAINDPLKQTRALMPEFRSNEKVLAVDLGGTWIRFGRFENGTLTEVVRAERPASREARIAAIREKAKDWKVDRVGVGTGGTVDPRTGEVWEAKEIIPDHAGTILNRDTLAKPTRVLNDGLATAWGHACHPLFAGKSVATLALGTGVGAGFVADGKIFCGPRGEYLRVNDLYLSGGETIEDVLGGANLTEQPSPDQQAKAIEAFRYAVRYLRAAYFPEVIVVCGGVGRAEWLQPSLHENGCISSPYAEHAGLYGAYHTAYANV